ncbi:hypothetical protein FE840_007795 [Peteryoungia desertarenae]|uniref:Uncharacterized protein n=1 Tax=Peteryoungia desertarenae TaxID=1813451 RepID=A0ABX6QLP6_9HYPH|nr:hypothetical protein [Peteryoungia desertarenae]QLF69455.1 hypothetical protein FE840_007795 [Peteryoungia desertarenae]
MREFEARAVIDWLTVEVKLNRSSQFQWLQKEIEDLFDRRLYVKNDRPLRNEAATTFTIKVQEPAVLQVRKALARLEAKFGFTEPPTLFGIEISVDFTPSSPDDLARATIMRVLSNHLVVERDYLEAGLSRPRTVWGGRGKVLQLVDGSGAARQDPYTDGTVEIGAEKADVRWRVMDKTVDQQNRAAGTHVDLPQDLRRARIEVTLNSWEIKQIGVSAFDKLAGVSFTTFQGRYFRFMLPTFPIQSAARGRASEAIHAWRAQQRLTNFRQAGNLSISALDKQSVAHRLNLRKSERGTMKRLGLRMPKGLQEAKGRDGTFIAYEDLSERVREALRRLGNRVAADFASGL